MTRKLAVNLAWRVAFALGHFAIIWGLARWAFGCHTLAPLAVMGGVIVAGVALAALLPNPPVTPPSCYKGGKEGAA